MEMGTAAALIGLAALASDTIVTLQTQEDERDSAEDAAKLQAKQLAAKKEQEEKERQNLLQKQLASRIAKFASSGLNTEDGGSVEAVLGGIEQEAEDDLSAIRDSYRYSLENINNSLASAQSRNLLARTNTLTDSVTKATGYVEKANK